MNMSGRRTSRLAASFNATLAGSQVQGLLDGASMSSNEGVSGAVPQGPDQLLDDVTTHSSNMDHDDGQGPVRPEDLDHPRNIGTPNHPPGIPNPAVNYAELDSNSRKIQTIAGTGTNTKSAECANNPGFDCKPKCHGDTNADNAAKYPTANKHC